MPKNFSASLLTWYNKNRRDLPWRHTKDPYKIWVSEMMLQQTTVSTVISYYDLWFKTFPTVESLAKAPIERVLKCWQGLGYYARARNLHKASQIVLDQYDGQLPKDPALVRALPGFGPYATGSVLSIAFDLPLQIIDANVRRVIMRIVLLNGYADTTQDKAISEYLTKVFPKTHAGDFNQALMELGALICKPKDPACLICPVRSFCKACAENCQESIPTKMVKNIQNIHAVIGIIKKDKKYFIQRRATKGLLQGMWEFPGGKIEKGETKEQALIREIKEELGVAVTASKYLFDVTHFYTQYKVRLSVFESEVNPSPKVGKEAVWAGVKDFDKYPLPSGTKKIIDKLKI